MLMLYLKMYRRGTDKPLFEGYLSNKICEKKQLFSNEGVTKKINFGKSNGFINEGVAKSN